MTVIENLDQPTKEPSDMKGDNLLHHIDRNTPTQDPETPAARDSSLETQPTTDAAPKTPTMADPIPETGREKSSSRERDTDQHQPLKGRSKLFIYSPHMKACI